MHSKYPLLLMCVYVCACFIMFCLIMFINILCSFVYMIDLYVGICMLHVSKVVTKKTTSINSLSLLFLLVVSLHMCVK